MEIISRARWDARYAAGFGEAPLPARELWLHHTASATPPVSATEAEDAGDVRQVERIGQERFGGGISYTFVVTPSGRIFEGTGVTRKGAHTKGRNSIARAIVLLGNYDIGQPSPQQRNATSWLVAYGAQQGWWPHQLAGGHRDAPDAQTACPGRFAYAAIPEINAAAGRLLRAGHPLGPAGGPGSTAPPQQPPQQPPQPPTEDDDMTPEDRALINRLVTDVAALRADVAKLKPGQVLPGRSPNSRNDSDQRGDDQFGTVLNAEANAADALVEARAGRQENAATRQEVAQLRQLLASAGGMGAQAFADQVATALARKLAG